MDFKDLGAALIYREATPIETGIHPQLYDNCQAGDRTHLADLMWNLLDN